MNELILISISRADFDKLIAESVKNAILEFFTDPVNSSNLHFPGNVLNDFISIEELSDAINTPRNSIYALVSNNEIPHIKRTKRLIFSRSDIASWLNEGKRKTKAQIEAQALADLSSVKKNF